MDNLKNLIEKNKASFTEKLLLEGDEKRFFYRLDKETNIIQRTSIARNKAPIWRIISLSAAAVILMFFTVSIVFNLYQTPEDEISQIYSNYIVDMVNISLDIENMDSNQEQNINAITFEARPLMDILPEEMPKQERIRVMNEYYSQKLAGVEKLKRRLLGYN